MNISLTPRLEAMIREKVESGLYNNSSEVVREALRLMERQDRQEQLRAAIAVGLEEFERGELVEWTTDSLDRLTREAEEEERQGVPIRRDVLP